MPIFSLFVRNLETSAFHKTHNLSTSIYQQSSNQMEPAPQSDCSINHQSTPSQNRIPQENKANSLHQGRQKRCLQHPDDMFGQKDSSLLCEPHFSIPESILDQGFLQRCEQIGCQTNLERKFQKGKIRSKLKMKDESIVGVSLTEGFSQSSYSMLQDIYNNISCFVHNEEQKAKGLKYSDLESLETTKRKSQLIEGPQFNGVEVNLKDEGKSRTQLITIIGSSQQESEQLAVMEANEAFVQQNNLSFSLNNLSGSESQSSDSSCLGFEFIQQQSQIEETEILDRCICQCDDITCLRGISRKSPFNVFYDENNGKVGEADGDMEESLLSLEIRRLRIGAGYGKRLRPCSSVVSDCMEIEGSTSLRTKPM